VGRSAQGELLAVACQGGVAHPPGYPLYTMLVRLCLRLPLGNPAERAASLSAAATATAALVLGQAVRRLCPHGGDWASLTSAGMFAFSPLVWTHATQPEVRLSSAASTADAELQIALECANATYHTGRAQAHAQAAKVL
jgi:hypothetical protein